MTGTAYLAGIDLFTAEGVVECTHVGGVGCVACLRGDDTLGGDLISSIAAKPDMVGHVSLQALGK